MTVGAIMDRVVGRIRSVNISETKGVPKSPQESVVVNDHGISGDGHAGPWHRQVSLLAWEEVAGFVEKCGHRVGEGDFAENLTTEGIDLRQVAPLDRFKVGEVELEVTQVGKKCHGATCAIFTQVGDCIMPREGLFARVVSGGRISAGMEIVLLPRPFRIHTATLSDRAARGEYPDRSGPAIREFLTNHFGPTRWHVEVSSSVLPDDVQILRQELVRCRRTGVDVVITTGGTGVGPRDITVDVVLDLADRTVPGIMEAIRARYGAANPNALLSRAVVAMMENTAIYTLPGSVGAVQEYMPEILKTMEHLFLMARGLGH